MEKIGSGAFQNCLSLTEIVIPEGIKRIAHDAFRHCRNLTTVIIADGVTQIDSYAFYDTGLKHIILPSTVENIANTAFKYCKELESITILCNVKSMTFHFFEGCEKLKAIYFGGTEEESEAVIAEALRFANLSIPIYRYSETKPTDTAGYYWHYVDGVPTPWED